jgi:hypothetical protein
MEAGNNRNRHATSFSESVVIKASPERAFAYLGDPATATSIDPAIISYTPDTVPMAVGTINTVKARMFGMRLTTVTQVLVWEPGRRMVIESVRPSRPVKGIATHLFEPHADGTLYTWAMDIVPTGFGGGVAARFFRRFMQRNARKQQVLLKQALEGAPPAVKRGGR